MPSLKFGSLKRSQIIIRITEVDRTLLSGNVKMGSKRHTELNAERAELFLALQDKDRALLAQWAAAGFPARD